MDRRHRLHGRSAPRRQVLCCRAPLVAGAQRRCAAAGLCRHPAQDRAAGRTSPGLQGAGAGRARRAGAYQPLRHRITRPHLFPGAGRPSARHRRGMNLARRGLLASLIGLLGGCSPVALLNATVPRKGYALEPDIAYGPDPRQKLDLYRPDTPRADDKAVIFFYGGSWDSGRKSDYLFVAQALCASGYIVVIPDYRIYPEVRFPAFVEDGAQAVRWASDRVGSGRLFVMGHSAGAHIALMLMTNTPY